MRGNKTEISQERVASNKEVEAISCPALRFMKSFTSHVRRQREDMTNREITAVAAKLIVAYLLFMVVLSFPIWVTHAYNMIDNKPLVLLVSGIGVVLGIIGVHYMRNFAHSLRADGADRAEVSVTGIQIEKILLRCLGLYFSIHASRDAVQSLISIGHYSNQGRDLFLTHVNLWTSVAVLLIGLSLIAKPMQWIWALRKLRRLGLERRGSPTPHSSVRGIPRR